MDLFKKKPEETPYETTMRESQKDMAWKNDFESLELEHKARVESMIELNREFITPERVKVTDKDGKQFDSPYHALLTKDWKISRIDDEDVYLLNLGQALVDYALFMGLTEFGVMLHAEIQGFLAAKASVGGFERLAQITLRQEQERLQGPQKERKI